MQTLFAFTNLKPDTFDASGHYIKLIGLKIMTLFIYT